MKCLILYEVHTYQSAITVCLVPLTTDLLGVVEEG